MYGGHDRKCGHAHFKRKKKYLMSRSQWNKMKVESMLSLKSLNVSFSMSEGLHMKNHQLDK